MTWEQRKSAPGNLVGRTIHTTRLGGLLIEVIHQHLYEQQERGEGYIGARLVKGRITEHGLILYCKELGIDVRPIRERVARYMRGLVDEPEKPAQKKGACR
jgi:hypothetical protein